MALDPTEQFKVLKDLTRSAGVLHHAQVMQLKLLPRVLFDKSTASTASVDFGPPDDYSPRIEYAITNPAQGAKALKASADRLNQFTKELLGDEWEVFISVKTQSGKKSKEFEYLGHVIEKTI